MADEGRPVEAATRVLNVTDSGYYAWRSRGPSARAVRHALVTETIRQVHQASRGTYGYRRVHAELTMGRGLVVGHGTVELLMARAGIKGVTGAPKWRRARPDLLATDLVDRRFTREGVNAVVLDVCSRRVVGWSIDSSPTAALPTCALGTTIDTRRPAAGRSIHSDHGRSGHVLDLRPLTVLSWAARLDEPRGMAAPRHPFRSP